MSTKCDEKWREKIMLFQCMLEPRVCYIPCDNNQTTNIFCAHMRLIYSHRFWRYDQGDMQHSWFLSRSLSFPLAYCHCRQPTAACALLLFLFFVHSFHSHVHSFLFSFRIEHIAKKNTFEYTERAICVNFAGNAAIHSYIHKHTTRIV